MASNHNAPAPGAHHDPAGSTQMFRAFVEEGAPSREAAGVPASGRRRREQAAGSGKAGAWIAVAVSLAAVFGIAVWLTVR
ncbi:hypothetical protein ACSHWO_18135 [Streptomyces sp. HUAS TT3]|uniref:hypothetical protein n=1 Tax=Streptomyces sp. HUAS TT3 TaxID=3447510 RepID=UPI003F65A1DB